MCHVMKLQRQIFWGFELEEETRDGEAERGRLHRNYVRPNEGLTNAEEEWTPSERLFFLAGKWQGNFIEIL